MSKGNLCLTRKSDETLAFQHLDENGKSQEVTLIVAQIKGNQSKLMINSPGNIQILRGEWLKSA